MDNYINEIIIRSRKIVHVFLVTRARPTKQSAFTLFILAIPHLHLYHLNCVIFN